MSIAVALLVGAVCLVVGVVTGTIFSKKQLHFRELANVQPSEDQPVRSVTEDDSTVYEEIDLQGTKCEEIQLMENAYL